MTVQTLRYCTISITVTGFATVEPAAPEIEMVYVPAGVPPPLPPPPPLFPPPQAARNSRPEIIKEARTIPNSFFFLEVNSVATNATPKIGSSIA